MRKEMLLEVNLKEDLNRDTTFECHYCHKMGHIKADCYIEK